MENFEPTNQDLMIVPKVFKPTNERIHTTFESPHFTPLKIKAWTPLLRLHLLAIAIPLNNSINSSCMDVVILVKIVFWCFYVFDVFKNKYMKNRRKIYEKKDRKIYFNIKSLVEKFGHWQCEL